MSEELKPFEGATHQVNGQFVKATQWAKDGDHQKVVRYPVERRVWKGLIKVSAKEQYALRFGDWVIEDEQGRIWVEAGEGEGRTLPPRYVALTRASLVDQVLTLALVSLLAYFTPADSLPFIFIGVTHLMYYSTLLAQWNGSANIFDLDEAADDIKLSAHTNTYSINQDTQDFFDDVTNEVTGTNYSAGGSSVGSQTVTRSTNTVTFDGQDVVWTQSGSGFSNARKFVLYRNTGSAATSRLFSVVTADADVGNVTGDLTIQWNPSGIATWSTT